MADFRTDREQRRVRGSARRRASRPQHRWRPSMACPVRRVICVDDALIRYRACESEINRPHGTCWLSSSFERSMSYIIISALSVVLVHLTIVLVYPKRVDWGE